MIPDFRHPFSAFTHNTRNPASFIIGQYYQEVDNAIDLFVALHKNGTNIEDPDVIEAVLEHCHLNDDGFEDEYEYIVKEVRRRIL